MDHSTVHSQVDHSELDPGPAYGRPVRGDPHQVDSIRDTHDPHQVDSIRDTFDPHQVDSIRDVFDLMAQADKNRSVASTDMNEYSSRSHQIVTIHADNESLETGSQYFGRMGLESLLETGSQYTLVRTCARGSCSQFLPIIGNRAMRDPRWYSSRK